jgi:hypothetical protein
MRQKHSQRRVDTSSLPRHSSSAPAAAARPSRVLREPRGAAEAEGGVTGSAKKRNTMRVAYYAKKNTGEFCNTINLP